MAGNPVALAAGIATLEVLASSDTYQRLETLGRTLAERFAEHPLSKEARLVRVGSVVWPYFEPAGALPKEASEISASAAQRYHKSYRAWLKRGVYLPPSAYEVCFLSSAHTFAHLDQYLDALASDPG
jgi:glutamate-1-semialdehyde 2,1-aminomutase